MFRAYALRFCFASNCIFPDEDEQLDLYCHGSLRYQKTTTVVDGDGVDTGASKLSLKCSEGQFLNLQTLVLTKSHVALNSFLPIYLDTSVS